MTENPEPRVPDGREDTNSVTVGEPTRFDAAAFPAGAEEEIRPNLDERERRMSTTRKPAGPPLRESAEPLESSASESNASETDVRPTDPI